MRRILTEAGLWSQIDKGNANKKKQSETRTADKPGQTVNIDLCFVPATHEVASKLPAVSGSSGRLVVERTIDKAAKEEPQWPGRIFEDPNLTYEEAMAGFVAAQAEKSKPEPTHKSPEAAAAAAVLAQKRQIRQEEEALRAERRIIRAQRLSEDQAWEAIRNQRRAEQAAQKAAKEAQKAAQTAQTAQAVQGATKEVAQAAQEAAQAIQEATKEAPQAAQEAAQAAQAVQEATKEAAQVAQEAAQAAQEAAQAVEEATKEAAQAAQAVQEATKEMAPAAQEAAQAVQEATKEAPQAAQEAASSIKPPTLAFTTTLTEIESVCDETNNLSTLSAQSAVESHHASRDAATKPPGATILPASSTDLRVQPTTFTIKTNHLPAESAPSAPSIVKNSNLPVEHATAVNGSSLQSATVAGDSADLPVEVLKVNLEAETSDINHQDSDSALQPAIDKSSNLPSQTPTFVTMSADLVKAVSDESTSTTNGSSAQATETINSPSHSSDSTNKSITQIPAKSESKKSASEAGPVKEAKTPPISKSEAKSPSISDTQWRQLKLQRRAQKEQRKQENIEWRQKRNSILQRLGALPFVTAWVAILVIVDNCTRQCIGLPLFMVGPHVTAQMIVDALREVLPPELQFLISDRGIHFRANVFAQFCQMSGFQHVLIAKHRPQSNGIAERFVRTLKEWLADKSWTSEEELIALLAEFREHYNDRPHQGIAMPGLSPNEYAKRIWVQ